MTIYPYSPTIPIDINGNLVVSGSGNIYDPDDVDGLDPLIPLGANGLALPSMSLEITPLRLIPGFFQDRPVVVWRSGSAAPVVLEAAGARIPPGGNPGEVLKKLDQEDYSVEWGVDGGGSGGGSATSGMVPAYEVGGKYVRPTQDPGVCVVFTGFTDPGAVAFENDRWDRLA